MCVCCVLIALIRSYYTNRPNYAVAVNMIHDVTHLLCVVFFFVCVKRQLVSLVSDPGREIVCYWVKLSLIG